MAEDAHEAARITRKLNKIRRKRFLQLYVQAALLFTSIIMHRRLAADERSIQQ
jgi:hypothetical protein